jgi:hypothetical protein
MSMPYRAAIRFRLRYLQQQIIKWFQWEDTDGQAPMGELYRGVDEIFAEVKPLLEALGAAPVSPTKDGEITQEMIDQANQYPINRLIEFNSAHKCHCPAHEDKTPSMFHAHRKNLAYCPVCCSGWGPIRYMMDFKDMKFRDAVRFLTR